MGSLGEPSPQPITAENVSELFPEVNTRLASSHRVAISDADLQGYDEEQTRLMEEVCIVLDENDVPIGSASKKVCKFLCNTAVSYPVRLIEHALFPRN